MGDDLARALERRSLRARQAGIAAAAGLLAVGAQPAPADLGVAAVAAVAAVLAFAVAFALAHREVRARSLAADAVAAPRRVRTVARSLERLARLAERGATEPRQTRPPRSVIELAPEVGVVRELALLLRAHPAPRVDLVEACDRFVFLSWNAALRGLDHEHLRRDLGRLRFALVSASGTAFATGDGSVRVDHLAPAPEQAG